MVVTKLLINEGADLRMKNKDGDTALHLSMEYEYFEQTRFLLEKGADKNILNEKGNRAITGQSGGRVGLYKWEGPVQMLVEAQDKFSVNKAYAAIQSYTGNCPDVARLIKLGFQRHKELGPGKWDDEKWTACTNKLVEGPCEDDEKHLGVSGDKAEPEAEQIPKTASAPAMESSEEKKEEPKKAGAAPKKKPPTPSSSEAASSSEDSSSSADSSSS